IALRGEVKKLYDARKSADEVKAAVDTIRETVRKNDRIARYIGGGFAGQVEKAYVELGGAPFAQKQAAIEEHFRHADAHGRQVVARPRQ
ncbi:MAG TPA: hypothetical protein VJW76_00750, partial [Verrucomicrobiae bacterium]|nr:hypothetical protein [Verrucomicrobiae bacterium]